MSAQKRLSPTADDFAMVERREAGATLRAIGDEFGLSASNVWFRLRAVDQYRDATKRLKLDPQNLEALGDLGVIDRRVAYSLKQRGASRLVDLADWCEAEFRSIAGPKQLAQIKAAMGEHGLFLHADRDRPIPRLSDFERYVQRQGSKPDQPQHLHVVGNIVYLPGCWPAGAS